MSPLVFHRINIPGEVLPYILAIYIYISVCARPGVCAAPKGSGFGPFWSEMPILVWNRVWFSRELRECMNEDIV